MTNLNTSSRRFTRGSGSGTMSWADGVRAVQQALDAAGEVEFTEAGPDGAALGFLLIRGERAVTVRGAGDTNVGVFASLSAAILHGFRLLDRAANHQRSARPRPSRARGRTTKELCR